MRRCRWTCVAVLLHRSAASITTRARLNTRQGAREHSSGDTAHLNKKIIVLLQYVFPSLCHPQARRETLTQSVLARVNALSLRSVHDQIPHEPRFSRDLALVLRNQHSDRVSFAPYAPTVRQSYALSSSWASVGLCDYRKAWHDSQGYTIDLELLESS